MATQDKIEQRTAIPWCLYCLKLLHHAIHSMSSAIQVQVMHYAIHCTSFAQGTSAVVPVAAHHAVQSLL